MFIPLAIDILKEPKTTTDTATPTAPTFAVPTGLDTFFLFYKSSLISITDSFLRFVHPLCYISCFSPGSTLVEVPPFSQFEVGSNFATVLDPVCEAATSFTRFDQLETNDLVPTDF